MSTLDDEIDDLLDEDEWNEFNGMNKQQLKDWLTENNIPFCKNKNKYYYKNIVIKYCALTKLEWDDLVEIMLQQYPTKRQLYNALNEEIIKRVDRSSLINNDNFQALNTIKSLKRLIYQLGFSKYPKSKKSAKWYQILYEKLVLWSHYQNHEQILTRFFHHIKNDLVYCIIKEVELHTRKKKRNL